jgi:hypothetical protein
MTPQKNKLERFRIEGNGNGKSAEHISFSIFSLSLMLEYYLTSLPNI